MFIFWFAIFILFLLVSLGSLREGMTSSQLAGIQGILNSSASPNDKLSQLESQNTQNFSLLNVIRRSEDSLRQMLG